MTLSTSSLPQLGGDLFLMDAGLETDLIFNHGHDLPAFAAHVLLDSKNGQQALETYFSGFLELACEHGAGFILDAPTWRAQRFFADELGLAPEQFANINQRAVAFSRKMQAAYSSNTGPIVINGLIGPRGDAYSPEDYMTASAATEYHSEQAGWLADAGVDMVTGLTIVYPAEGIGILQAAKEAGLPAAMSFTVETDGRLPGGQSLKAAIEETDDATGGYAAYFMVNCAHPDHFSDVLASSEWAKRIRGLRCNASRKSHAELDECETLDAGDPEQLANGYTALLKKLPWANIFGGCCGTDLRHIKAITKAIGQSRTEDMFEGERTAPV